MTFQSQCSELEQNNQPFIGEILLLEDLLQAVEPVLHMVEGGGEGGYSLLLLLSPVQAAAQPRVEDVGGGQLSARCSRHCTGCRVYTMWMYTSMAMQNRA